MTMISIFALSGLLVLPFPHNIFITVDNGYKYAMVMQPEPSKLAQIEIVSKKKVMLKNNEEGCYSAQIIYDSASSALTSEIENKKSFIITVIETRLKEHSASELRDLNDDGSLGSDMVSDINSGLSMGSIIGIRLY